MKIFKSIVLGVSVILCVTFLIIFCVQMFSVNKSDVSATEKFTITSNVENVIQQKYSTTIKGTIKNNTDKPIINLTIIISAETTTLKHKDTFYIEIPLIEAGAEISINELRVTNENFEKVKEVRYQVEGGERKFISNGEGVVINFWAFLCLIPIIIFGILSIKMAISLKHEKYRTSTQVVDTTSKKDDTLTYIIAQQQENERRRIELEKQRIDVESSKVEFEKQKQADARPRYCSYCGAKNDASADKCKNCGSTME